MRPTLAALLLAASIAPVARSEIVEFDFESMPGNSDSAGGDFTALFLNAGDLYAVITRTSGERFTVWNSEGRDVPAEWGRRHLSPAFNFAEDDYLVMTFSEPVRRVSIELGDYGQDNDLAELFAYSEMHAQGELVDSSWDTLGDDDIRYDDPTMLRVDAAEGEEIWSIRFRGGRSPFYQSTYIDNIRVDTVPAPASAGVLAVLGLSMKRRR